MNKIKILQYCDSLDNSCISRTIERYLRHLNKERFEIYVIYNNFNENDRLAEYEEIVGRNNMRGFFMLDRSLQFNTPRSHNFHETLKSFKTDFDIFHIYRSGCAEFPLNTETKKYFKKTIETNLCGCDDIVFQTDLCLCPSQFVFNKKNIKSNCEILHTGVDENDVKTKNLRTKLSLEKRFVFGYLCCEESFSSIALDGFKKFNQQFFSNNISYLIVNPCKFTKEHVEINRIPNVVFCGLNCTDKNIYDFYNSIDIFAHYNTDGDVFNCSMQEAMMCCKPIITHPTENSGHLETVNKFGFVAKDSDEYCCAMKILYTNEELRKAMARGSEFFAMQNFDIKKTVKKLEQHYINVLK
jgi:glycosyltransferase involved in cell wall biosynthesis